MLTVDNSKFNNSNYNPGKSIFLKTIWYCINLFIFKSYLFPFYSFKVWLLRLFGAKIGIGLIIKPNVNIKYPWLLEVGNNVWIGESAWIDNLVKVSLGNNVCISQGAIILTGNHNYSLQSFDLMVGKVTLEDGVWIGAKSVVCPGVMCCSHSVLTAGSVTSKKLEPYSVYTGNPATKSHNRNIIN